MIAYLNGKVISSVDGTIILKCGDIGYEIACSRAVYNRLVSDGNGEVFTYMAVREDGVYLYGFDNLEEKSLFLKLISVSGVGPKMGITILSAFGVSDILLAISKGDIKSLSQIKGVGKKTAERIVLELKGTLEGIEQESESKPQISGEGEMAVTALMNWGYTRQESEKAVASAIENGAVGLENIIKGALKCFVK